MASTEVHVLDRLVPEVERFLLIEDIGCYLIAEGLLSNEEYLMLARHTSKKEAVVELLQLVKRKGPFSLQSFLYALYRSCTESTTPHQGHIHLWELFQANMSGAHSSKKHKSKQKSKLGISWFARVKRNKHSKEVSLPLWASTPHLAAGATLNNHHYNTSSSGAATVSPPTSRHSIMSSFVTLSGGTPSDEDSYRNSTYDSTCSCSQDSYNPVPPPSPPSDPPLVSNTNQSVIEELQKDNKELKRNLKKTAKELEKYKGKVKEQSLEIEDLKAENEKTKSEMQTLEVDIHQHDSLIDYLLKQVTSLQSKIKVMQEKESLKMSMQTSVAHTRGSGGRSRRSSSQSLGYGSTEFASTASASLTSINEIEELRSEYCEKNKVLQSKLYDMNQICKGITDSSKLNRKWHSDNKLSRYKENNPSFLHSQT